MTVRKDTPYLDRDSSCDGCSGARVPVVRVGEILSLGEGDDEGIHPDSNTACLCRVCLEKALACFEAIGDPI